MTDDEAITKLVQQTYDHCAAYLRKVGIVPRPMLAKARTVVWARYYDGDDGWERLKEAIGELEGMVGRPANESDI